MFLLYFILALVFVVGTALIRRIWFARLSAVVFLGIQVLFTVYLCFHKNFEINEYFTIDAVSILFSVLLLIIGLAVLYHSLIYLKNENSWNYSIFISGFIGLIASITGVYCANNIMVTWIFMEATTLSVAALIYHNRTARVLEATWKYVFICSVGIAIAYIGILLLSTSITGVDGADMSYKSLATYAQKADPLYLKLAFLFIITGYSAKLEIFPLYTIGIDANYVAPAPVSAFISTALVNAGFVAVFRIYQVFSGTPVFEWVKNVLLITGVLSLLIAAIYMQRVKNFKRLFAYSTVENMGLVAICLGVGGIGYYAAFVQVILHAFIKSSLFLQMGQAHRIFKSYKIFKTGNYFQFNGYGALVILIGTIAITAIPPSGLFISEMLLFKSLFLNGHWIILTLVMLLLTVILYGISAKVYHMLFFRNNLNIDQVEIHLSETISQYLFLILPLVFCFYQPFPIVQLINEAISGIHI